MKRLSHASPTTALFIFISFWVTALLVRGIIFLYVRQGILPAIFVRGFHVHHFITGFVFLLLALFLTSHMKHRKFIPAALCGVGLALVFDELMFWTRGHFDYWNIVNLAGTAVVGTFLAAWYEYSKRKSMPPIIPYRPYALQMMFVFIPVILAIIFLLDIFSYYSTTAARAKSILIPLKQEIQEKE